MKKIYSFLKYTTIILLFLGFANVSNAQTAVDITNEAWDWTWNGTAAKVTNPLPSANNNATVWEFSPSTSWGGFSYGNTNGLGIDFSTYSKFECMVYCPGATSSIKLFLEAQGAGDLDLGYIDCKDNWAIATGSVAGWDSSAATKFAIKNGDYFSGMKIYFDNIKFIDPSNLTEVIYDNAETITKDWGSSWGGISHTTVANPLSDAVNGTSHVREVVGTAEWGGLGQWHNETIGGVVDLSVFSQFEMLVYCPGVTSLQLIIGIESGATADFEINQACETGWVKVTQDLTAWAEKGGAQKFFIKNGNGTANVPIYIDEIKFVKPSSAPTANKTVENLGNRVSYYRNNITIAANDNEPFQYALYNTLGHIIAQGEASSTVIINTNNLSKGVYIANIVSENGKNTEKVSVY